ncbi:hypothetical protein K3165_10945 [Qipengyuania sp. 1XM1-15A]|uniref:hypothetical protein n=1 Tax=Qipengyuania xiamenensis TaxID=2867237 RepID=UPI001C86955A|nr:hypothetical protein [Qipengyuania xiamenensis]MBX7533442.1 hypothetical protein [Qipengyuania xiamenensis]
MPEWASIVLLVAGIGFIMIAIATAILHFFVGLRQPPAKRAALTVAVAYIIVASLLVLYGPTDYRLFAPAVPIPGAIVAYFFWWHDFRMKWIEAEDVGDQAIATDDWRAGIVRLLMVLTIGVGIVLYKALVTGMLDSIF